MTAVKIKVHVTALYHVHSFANSLQLAIDNEHTMHTQENRERCMQPRVASTGSKIECDGTLRVAESFTPPISCIIARTAIVYTLSSH